MHPLYGALPVPYMYQSGLRAVLWSHICVLMRLLAAEPRSTAGPLFLSQCPRRTLLLTLYSMVCHCAFQEQGQCFFITLSCFIPFCLEIFFSFSSFCLKVGIVRLDRVFGLVGCRSLSPSLALPTSFNNKDNNGAIENTILFQKIPM